MASAVAAESETVEDSLCEPQVSNGAPVAMARRIGKVSSALLGALFTLQVFAWFTTRGRLTSLAPQAIMQAEDNPEATFPCTVISDVLARQIGQVAFQEWKAQAELDGITLITDIELRTSGAADDLDCSQLHISVARNTPFGARVDSRQSHPDFDSNTFRSYFFPFLGKWVLIGSRQVGF